MGNTMTKEQAMQLIKQVCAAFQGNLDAHRNIQTALGVIEKELEPKLDQPEVVPIK